MNSSENIIQCPHCQEYIIILELNCKIFRHGIFKKTGEQIDPHSTKEDCERFVQENQIYGCGKPFRIVVLEKDDDYENKDDDYEKDKDKLLVEKCDYI